MEFLDLFHGAWFTFPCQALECRERSSAPSASFMS